jgi:hypothetical protein
MSNDLKIMNRAARQSRLEHEAQVGRPRAKTFGGRKSPKQDRREAKQMLRSR